MAGGLRNYETVLLILLVGLGISYLKPEYSACGLNHEKSFVIWSKRVVMPHHPLGPAAVHVHDGEIVGVVPIDHPPHFSINYGDLVISPGVVDIHVHLNEPGREDWEGFVTGTQAAAAGGVTTVIDMPLNSKPAMTTAALFRDKLAAAKGKLFVDAGFWGGLVPENAENVTALNELLKTGIIGLKAFMSPSGIGDFGQTRPHHLAAGLRALTASGHRPLMVHAEMPPDEPPPPPPDADPRAYATYLASRPRQWEQDAIRALIDIAGDFHHSRVHIAHVSDADSLALIRGAQGMHKALTAETCPHYLTFAAEEVPAGDTRFKCAPPIREEENRERLWEGLREGVLEVVSSDHSPAPPELKLPGEGDFMRAWGGISGLQLTLPVVWTAARARGFAVDALARLLSEGPSKVAGLAHKGAIQPKMDADLVVWDPEASFVVEPAALYHRHKATPYEGRKLYGRVVATYVRGHKVYAADEKRKMAPKACGQPVLYQPALGHSH